MFASERDFHACTTYHANFGDVPFGDITQIDTESIAAHDLLTAGFPCQSFSKAGALNPETGQQGLNDANGQLFFEVIRVLEARQPRGFLLENVAELLTHDEGRSHAVVVAALRGVGYCVDCRVINSLALLPQHRERLYLVGVRADLAGASMMEHSNDWRFPWPPGLEVGESCLSVQPFGRRCPCRRLDTSGNPSLRQILQSDDELPSDIWLTASQWSKIARGGAGVGVVGSGATRSSTPRKTSASNGGDTVAAHSRGTAAVADTCISNAHCRCCRRLAWLDGASRTLMSSYRRGYEMYSEFVRNLCDPNAASVQLHSYVEVDVDVCRHRCRPRQYIRMAGPGHVCAFSLVESVRDLWAFLSGFGSIWTLGSQAEAEPVRSMHLLTAIGSTHRLGTQCVRRS